MRPDLSRPLDSFVDRHLGVRPEDEGEMLATLGLDSIEALVDAVVPRSIRSGAPLALGPGKTERDALAELRQIARLNRPYRSFIGLGYHRTLMPPVIQRNVLEDPGWYTQYTPYQAEIAQGRLEALMNFQTLVAELAGLPLANASLLDEATAAAEAMGMCWAVAGEGKNELLLAESCHPQTAAVVATRAAPLGIEVRLVPRDGLEPGERTFAVLVQYPESDGRIAALSALAERVHVAGARLIVATDPLALLLLQPPGEQGADIAVGSTQRFGVPMMGGGPHAAFLTAREELGRSLPGRIVGRSRDAAGRSAYRLALQTREQHIRRERATSNICTAQVLPAILASMYAVYHGPEGLRRIATRVHQAAALLAAGLERLGLEPAHPRFFDTVRVDLEPAVAERVRAAARERCVNLRPIDETSIGVSLDEAVSLRDLELLLEIFAEGCGRRAAPLAELEIADGGRIPEPLRRRGRFLEQEVFQRYHSEHQMLRYLARLRQRDLSLIHSMIPLGSCTMKLNATAEMMPVTWDELASIHPFAPLEQQAGYGRIFADLDRWLAEITGLPAVSLQPNAGSQGEYTGLLVVRAFHASRGEENRDVCLIPTSAHGTNPASAVMAGMRVVAVACDAAGNIDLGNLEAKAAAHADRLGALMITYPSTHGVFEENIVEVCDVVHRHGGLIYLDGANMNAQVGLCRPGDFGADVCHLNLHKTFCIPHGGGGPGMGPICVTAELAAFLPGHPLVATGGRQAIGTVAAAPYGSPGILPISWMYIAMMGGEGLTRASRVAILNANYMAKKLAPHYPVLFTGANGFVAHEFIIDLRAFRQSAAVSVDDVAKRLMDYGFHAPTMSWPVAGTMMVEPTESESRAELDRFCDAMIAIREEIRAIETGRVARDDSPLAHAPHTAEALAGDWDRPYSRAVAAFPAPWLARGKFWPPVGRIDNAWGDRHLVCTCDTVAAYAAGEE